MTSVVKAAGIVALMISGALVLASVVVVWFVVRHMPAAADPSWDLGDTKVPWWVFSFLLGLLFALLSATTAGRALELMAKDDADQRKQDSQSQRIMAQLSERVGALTGVVTAFANGDMTASKRSLMDSAAKLLADIKGKLDDP